MENNENINNEDKNQIKKPSEIVEYWKTRIKTIDDINKIPLGELKVLYFNELISNNDFKQEHDIMKKFIIRQGLWEKFLNDDKFNDYLRKDCSGTESIAEDELEEVSYESL